MSKTKNAFMIRNKLTKEFIKLNSRKHVWFMLNHCKTAITNHNLFNSYKNKYGNKINPILSDEYEIVMFDLIENKTINIKDKI